jgi:hypothetical protein
MIRHAQLSCLAGWSRRNTQSLLENAARHTRCSDTDGKLHSRHLPSFLYEKREEQTVEPLRQKGRKEFDFQMREQNVKMKEKKKNSLPPFFDYIPFPSQIHPFSFPYFPFASSVFLTWRSCPVFSRLFSSEVKCLALFHRLKDRVA